MSGSSIRVAALFVHQLGYARGVAEGAEQPMLAEQLGELATELCGLQLVVNFARWKEISEELSRLTGVHWHHGATLTFALERAQQTAHALAAGDR